MGQETRGPEEDYVCAAVHLVDVTRMSGFQWSGRSWTSEHTAAGLKQQQRLTSWLSGGGIRHLKQQAGIPAVVMPISFPFLVFPLFHSLSFPSQL